MRRFGTLAALLLLAACAVTPPAATPSPQPSRFQTAPPLPLSPSASAPSGTPGELSAARLDAIRTDLTNRGTAVTGLRVVSAENVTFSDGSLGCPQPGVQYTQALVNGMRVVVEAAGRSFDYRFGTSDNPRLCEPRRPGPASTTR